MDNGEQVTHEKLFERAVTSIAPDGSKAMRNGEMILPSTSTAFKTAEGMVASELLVREKALPIRYPLLLAIYEPPFE